MDEEPRSRDSLPLDGALDDTERWARNMLVERWRTLGPMERMQILCEHFAALERISIVGLRMRYPEADDEELRARAAALRIGRAQFARLTGMEFTW